MPEHDCFILLGLGGLFVILGVAFAMWGKWEKKGYYSALSGRSDVREFLEQEPERPEPGGLKIGGWIAIAIGLVMMAIGGVFWLWS